MNKQCCKLSKHAHWLLRVAFASVFIYHGLDKFTGPGIAGFAEMLELPFLIALLVALAEVAGGLLVLIGPCIHDLLTRLGGLAVVPVMLGAIIMVHWRQWSIVPSETHPMGGMEFSVVLLLLALYFIMVGNHTDLQQTSKAEGSEE